MPNFFKRGETDLGGGGGGISVIEKVELTAESPNIVFSGIPDTYQHLMLIAKARSTRDANDGLDNLALRFNSDTANNYDRVTHYTSGTSVTAQIANGDFLSCGPIPGFQNNPNLFGASQVIIPDYASTSHFTAIHASGGFADPSEPDGTDGLVANDGSLKSDANVWRSVAAVIEVMLFPYSGPNFAVGTMATLYGLA